MKVKIALNLLLISVMVLGVQPTAAQAHSYPHPLSGVQASSGPPLEALATDDAPVIHVPGAANLDLQAAINQVPDGGIIEISAGVYPSPVQGFYIQDARKSFTIQAAPGEQVILDGGHVNRVLAVRNLPGNENSSVVFKGLTFASGYTKTDGVAGGVTLYRAKVTFIDCTFRDHRKDNSPGQTVGAAVAIADGSTVFFFNALFENNTSENGGAGIGVRDSSVYVHNSIFKNNQTFVAPNLGSWPGGGAINAGNSILRISNSRFEGNQVASHGGAIWAIGEWSHPAGMDIIIANATFVGNQARQHSFPNHGPAEGGAVVIEDKTRLRVYNSRFLLNKGMIGGAMSIFRARAEIYASAFLGNQATDILPTSGFGGAINFNFHDHPGDASLVIEDTLIQGRYQNVTTVAQFGGGLQIGGHVLGTRPTVRLRRVVFNECDVIGRDWKAGTGGAIGVSGANFLMEDSMVLNSDAFEHIAPASGQPSGSIAGGMVVYQDTLVDIRRSVFARNSAVTFGGAVFIQGAHADISDSWFLENEISPGVSEEIYQSYGAAIFSAPLDPDAKPNSGDELNVSGSVNNNVFSKNIGLAVFDDDRTDGPINDMRYNGNQFYADWRHAPIVYYDNLALWQSGSGLNGVVVNRRNGTSTPKAPNGGNTALTAPPTLGKLLAAPPHVLAPTANGDPELIAPSYLGYAWSGGWAELNGNDLPGTAGVLAFTQSGQASLSVDGQPYPASIGHAPTPEADMVVAPMSASTKTMTWNVEAGAFLDAAMDRGMSIPAVPSGSVTVPDDDKVYNFYAITQEGGAVCDSLMVTPILSAPNRKEFLAGLVNPLKNEGVIPITNIGSGVLAWTAHTHDSYGMISLASTSGSIDTFGTLKFTIDVSGLDPGDYEGVIDIEAGEAGSASIVVHVKVVDRVYGVFVPIVVK